NLSGTASSRIISDRPYSFRRSSASKRVASVRNSCSRPSATSTSATESRASELANHALQQRNELPAHAPCRLHHLGMIERPREYARGHVGNARETEHVHAHVARDDGLRDG